MRRCRGSMNFSENKPEKLRNLSLTTVAAQEDTCSLLKKHPRPSIQGDLRDEGGNLRSLKISNTTCKLGDWAVRRSGVFISKIWTLKKDFTDREFLAVEQSTPLENKATLLTQMFENQTKHPSQVTGKFFISKEKITYCIEIFEITNKQPFVKRQWGIFSFPAFDKEL